MVRVRREDRVQIDAGDAERGEIRELFADPVQIPAEIIVRRIVLRAAVRGEIRRFVPVVVHEERPSRRAVIRRGAQKPRAVGAEKAVGEDLIDDGVPEPFRRLKRAVVHRQTEDLRGVGKMRFAAVRTEIPAVDTEAVAHAAGNGGGGKRGAVRRAVPVHRKRYGTVRQVQKQLDHGARVAVDAERNRFVRPDRAERVFVMRITRMIIPVHTGSLYAFAAANATRTLPIRRL